MARSAEQERTVSLLEGEGGVQIFHDEWGQGLFATRADGSHVRILPDGQTVDVPSCAWCKDAAVVGRFCESCYEKALDYR